MTRHGESVSWGPMFADGTPTGGVWVAYHSDWSGFVLFGVELDALRHAVANSMQVGFAQFGEEIGGGRFPKMPEAVLDTEEHQRLVEQWRGKAEP